MGYAVVVQKTRQLALSVSAQWFFLGVSFFGSVWFWGRQLVDYSQSVEGLLLSFPLLGALSIAILATLALEDARQARQQRALAWAVVWLYVSIFILNVAVVIAAISFGAQCKVLDGVVVAIAVATLLYAHARKQLLPLRSTGGRFWLGIALKVMPQYGQGIRFLFGSAAISFSSIGMLPLLILCRLLPSYARVCHDKNPANLAAFNLVRYDFYCGIAVVGAWLFSQVYY